MDENRLQTWWVLVEILLKAIIENISLIGLLISMDYDKIWDDIMKR